ncbi:MAG: hypothetical protein QF893_09770 [Alphaproteobacteria bacterium]|jgi:hypothetical protein|nr:hypothetical protein [Alphaproteobacteria bacterium]
MIRMSLARFFALAVAVALPMAACQTAPPPRSEFSEIRFSGSPPIGLDVARIVIEDRYAAPSRPPNVEHRFPYPPAAVAQRWAEDRLRAVGRHGTARVLIEEAGVVSEPLATKKGLAGAFKREGAERLVGRLRMRIEVGGEGGLAGGFAEAGATASRTILEDVSLQRRETIYHEFTRDLVQELDRTMEKSIRKHLYLLIR